MPEILKAMSPFYPGQPVPVELFVGRSEQIQRILDRGARQVAAGKPIAMYIQGEYGIGKSSMAHFAQSIGETDHKLHSIYVSLAGAQAVQDVPQAVIQAVVRSGVFYPKRSEKIRTWLAKYISRQQLFGFSLNLEALKQDIPQMGSHFAMLDFLKEVHARLCDEDVKGLFLVLDEINGITADPQFSHFIKGLVDTNAMARPPLPLLLVLSGVEERRREMIQKHQPIDRIFDVIDIKGMSGEEMLEFFSRSFQSVQMRVSPDAMDLLVRYSAGFPKIMHLVGDCAYWLDRDGCVDHKDALSAVMMAAEEVGKKYVDQQVYRALRSSDYRSILAKIAKISPDSLSFTKEEVLSGLTESERGKFDNFLQRMKRLNVIRPGEARGEYVFNLRMVRLYIWLDSLKGSQERR